MQQIETCFRSSLAIIRAHMASISSSTAPHCERLTDFEANNMTVGPAITTITFLRGDPTLAADWLRHRLGELVEANP